MQVSTTTAGIGSGTNNGQQLLNSGQQTNGNTIEQLQLQMNQMMALMMGKGSVNAQNLMPVVQNSLGTPADHISHMAGFTFSMMSYIPYSMHQKWIIDTGASNHTCCDIHFMRNVQTLSQPFYVTLPNNNSITVNQIGTVKLHHDFVLPGVLLVPEFHCNLLSVSKFTQDSKCLVVFLVGKCMFQDQNQVKTPSAHTVTASSSSSHSSVHNFKLWHLRLGHAPLSVLQHVPALGSISGHCNIPCLVCPCSKQTLLSFPKHSLSHANESFLLVHMDIWGPYHIQYTSGSSYFLTVLMCLVSLIFLLHLLFL